MVVDHVSENQEYSVWILTPRVVITSYIIIIHNWHQSYWTCQQSHDLDHIVFAIPLWE